MSISYLQNINLGSGDILSTFIEATDNNVTSITDIDYIIQQIHDNRVSSCYKIYVLYPDETINYQIPNEDIKIGGSYDENYQDGQRRSLSFSLYNYDKKYSPDINTLWAGTRLRLDVGLTLSSGVTYWVRKGIYVVDKVTPSLTVGDFTVQVSASDKFAIFENKTGSLETTYEIDVNSDIESVIHDILLMDLGNGNPMDSRPFLYHSSFKGQKTQQSISKSAGETLGSILLELATQLSAEIFYNAQGNLVLVPTNEVDSDESKPLLYNLYESDGDMSSFDFTYDMSSIVNRIIVLGSSTDTSFCKAIAVNDDSSSPLCYQRIGYRTGSVISDSNITTDLLAEERAKYELRQQLILKSSTSLTVDFNPLLSVNNLISITCETFGLECEKFLIQSISCSLDYIGSMSMTVSNIRNFPLLTT